MKDSSEEHRIISDEMNLAEFPINVLSDRVPKGVTELVFEDVVEDRITGDTAPAKITVRAHENVGLPTSTDDEVLMACLEATRASGFKERKVRFKPRQMLLSMKWHPTGPYYANLKRALDRISIESVGAYWDKGKKKPVRDIVGILDRWKATGRDPETGLPEDAFFVWGDFMWESFKSGNLRNIDYDYWLGLDSAVSRRAYRFLGKQLYRSASVSYWLQPYAVNKLGMSQNNSNGEIKRQLKETHSVFEADGFCKAEYSGTGKNAKVTYTALGTKEELAADPLVAALKERGVNKVEEVLTADNRDRVTKVLKNYDHRRSMGESIGAGWLRRAITSGKPVKFRKDYVDAEKKKAKIAEADAKGAARLQRVKHKLNAPDDEDNKKYEAFVGSLTKSQYAAFRKEAIAKAPRSSRAVLDDPDAASSKGYAAHLTSAMKSLWRKQGRP